MGNFKIFEISPKQENYKTLPVIGLNMTIKSWSALVAKIFINSILSFFKIFWRGTFVCLFSETYWNNALESVSSTPRTDSSDFPSEFGYWFGAKFYVRGLYKICFYGELHIRLNLSLIRFYRKFRFLPKRSNPAPTHVLSCLIKGIHLVLWNDYFFIQKIYRQFVTEINCSSTIQIYETFPLELSKHWPTVKVPLDVELQEYQ